jgi:uncharacterized membrane protein
MSVDAAQEVTVEIDAPLDACVTTILDFEHYPRWSAVIETARVLERQAGIARLVEFHLNMKVKTIRYVLEYTYRKPNLLTWRGVDGDIEFVEGSYRFKKLSPSRTEATCRQEIRLGFWMPGPLRRLAERTALKQSVEEFKAEAERRLAAAAKASGKAGEKQAEGRKKKAERGRA